jgi:hypothetical protein
MRQGDRAKFVRLANARVPRALKDIALIGNLSVRSNYDYSKADAAAIISALKEAVANCEAALPAKSRPPEGSAWSKREICAKEGGGHEASLEATSRGGRHRLT